MAIQFNITNRWTGAVQVAAEIECDENESYSIKRGLAVRWAVSAGADLYDANLSGADLRGANLCGTNLCGTDLCSADLRSADLRGANLCGTDLFGADLFGADLFGADLFGADLGFGKIAKGNSLLMLGIPDGWSALTYFTVDGVQRVKVGCQDKTIPEALAYWANKPDRREVLACVDYAEAIGRIRGWTKQSTQETA